MSKTIVITSGKGGVGKTTTSVNLGCALAQQGKKVVIIDFDMGLRNTDLLLGLEKKIVYSLYDVCKGTTKAVQALLKTSVNDNLFLLAADMVRDAETLTKEGVQSTLAQLKELGFDFILCDSPAGIEIGASMAMFYADHALVVANAEVSSIRDADRVMGLIQTNSECALAGKPMPMEIVLTRYDMNKVVAGHSMSVEDVEQLLQARAVGVIPEDEAVLRSTNRGVPVVMDEKAFAGVAYRDLAARLLGQSVEMKFTKAPPSKGWASKVGSFFGFKG